VGDRGPNADGLAALEYHRVHVPETPSDSHAEPSSGHLMGWSR
jgi:hypothetical protein